MSEERFDRLESMMANMTTMIVTLTSDFTEFKQEQVKTNHVLTEGLAKTNEEVAKLGAGLAKTNEEVAKLSAGLAKTNEEVARLNQVVIATQQAVLENAERLDRFEERVDQRFDQVDQRFDRIELHIKHQDERFRETDNRLVNIEHGMYRVSCVERAQNKMLVHLHEVDVELSLVKDKVPTRTELKELEKVSS